MENYFGPDDDWYVGESSIDEAVDREFRQLTNPLMRPYGNECLVCFLVRMVPVLEPVGFAMTLLFRDSNAPRATGLGPRLLRLGIHGYVNLLRNGTVANGFIWVDERCADCNMPLGAPPCMEVRRGSTQPCNLWLWRRHAVLVGGLDSPGPRH